MRPKLEYKRVDTRTVKGIQKAERLQANGWTIVQSGLFSVMMEKKRAS